jgi:hypothetical protein
MMAKYITLADLMTEEAPAWLENRQRRALEVA